MAHQFDDQILHASLVEDDDLFMLDCGLAIEPVPGLYIWQREGVVTMNEPELLDRYTVRFSWSSNLDDPTFYVYRNGALHDVTTATSITVTVDPGEALVIEVLDDPDARPAAFFPGRFILAWAAVSGADHYRIEEYSGGQWVKRAKVSESGAGYYRWFSRWLEDDTVHQFRIVPVGESGNDGSAIAWSARMVRQPDVPHSTFTYSQATGKVTVDDA